MGEYCEYCFRSITKSNIDLYIVYILTINSDIYEQYILVIIFT